MEQWIPRLVALLLAGGGFVYSARRLFKKGIPLYYQLLACGGGCFALSRLFGFVHCLCGDGGAAADIGVLGLFGCCFFLLSANYGQLDSIVDDGADCNRRARLLAAAAPAGVCLLGIAQLLLLWAQEPVSAVLYGLAAIPAAAAAYFNLKHLLLPMDDFGFLRSTRPCNAAALVFFAMTGLWEISMASGRGILREGAQILASGAVLLLAISAVKGAKAWRT